MRCHSSTSHSWIAASVLPPALLNSSVEPPSCSVASLTAAVERVEVGDVDGVRDAVDLGRDRFGAVAVHVDHGDARALFGHAPARRRAIPEPPPVTIARCPRSSCPSSCCMRRP